MSDYRPGDRVRLVQTRGEVEKKYAGRLMTVRAVREDAVRVDDGDPAISDINTCGGSLFMWVSKRAIEPANLTPEATVRERAEKRAHVVAWLRALSAEDLEAVMMEVRR